MTSCNNWLDVSDSNVITEDELFKSEKGHKQQLTGIYNVMADFGAYGGELFMGLPDVIAQYWSVTTNDDVARIMKGDYTTSTTEGKLLGIWSKLYEGIGNANILIEKLGETNTKGFEDYDLMKGEALALRAYLHLDLLRLFGPVIKNGTEQLSIPYRTVFDKNSIKRMKASEVMQLIENDLLAAKTLLETDPVKTVGREIDTNDKTNMAKNYRGIRMNYYAVVGTLARLSMLKNEKPKAYEYAMEIINAKRPDGTTKIFELVKRADVVNNDKTKIDRIFSREIIFGLYDTRLKSKLGGMCAFMGKDSPFPATMYIVDNDLKDHIYKVAGNGSATDYRLQHWWGVAISFPVFHKYYRDADNKAPYDPILSLLRISEMYYIAAEAKVGVDNVESLALLNDVRTSRGITAKILITNISSDAELAEQIFDESRKDFWGEGQLFYSYKRLFKDIKTLAASIPASNSLFVLPIPKNEIEYANN